MDNQEVKNSLKLNQYHDVGSFVAPTLNSIDGSDQSASTAAYDPKRFQVGETFNLLEKIMHQDNDNLIDKVRGIYAFKITNSQGEQGTWIVNAKNNRGHIYYVGLDKPNVTFIMNDKDANDLLTDKLDPKLAFSQGKIKLEGNRGFAMKLIELQKVVFRRMQELQAKL